MLSPMTQRQFERLKARYPDAMLQELPSGAALLTIPNFPVPAGWSASVTTVRFIVPAGYPGPFPDCFWCESGMLLASGAQPQSSQDPNAIPETNLQGRWFSWHVLDAQKNWNPNRDDLLTYAGIISGRFAQAR